MVGLIHIVIRADSTYIVNSVTIERGNIGNRNFSNDLYIYIYLIIGTQVAIERQIYVLEDLLGDLFECIILASDPPPETLFWYKNQASYIGEIAVRKRFYSIFLLCSSFSTFCLSHITGKKDSTG